MLAHVGDILAPGGLKLAPRRLKIALCWLKLAPRRPTWFLKASQVPQDEAKMAPRWLPNWYVLASWSFFRDLLPDLRFQCMFVLLELWKHQFSTFFGTNFDEFWVIFGTRFTEICIIFGILGRVCPKRCQDTLMIAAGWHTWVYLDPTWGSR